MKSVATAVSGRVLLASVALGAVFGCQSISEEVTPTAECVSGKKWIGGDVGHPEMHPGQNCVGCHQDNDGPPLQLGGTVYASTAQEHDCYGVEGAIVVITDGNLETFALETNAAGNFFLEGDPAALATPLSVVLHGWDEFGVPQQFPMATVPETGDCGHCHGTQDELPSPVTARTLTRKFPTSSITLNHPRSAYGF